MATMKTFYGMEHFYLKRLIFYVSFYGDIYLIKLVSRNFIE